MNRTGVIIALIVYILILGFYGYSRAKFFRAPLLASLLTSAVEPQMISGGPKKDVIASLDDPAFESVATADQYLDDKGLGVLFERNGRARFYPFQLLVWHEVVNDEAGSLPIVVTYSPLTFSSAVYERAMNGETLTFGVTGDLYNNNSVLYEKSTGDLWIQATGTAIRGEAKGAQLKRLPSFVLSWVDYKKQYPRGDVLSRPQESVRDYTINPYSAYETNQAVWFPLDHEDARLNSKRVVAGFEVAGASKAYPRDEVERRNEIDDVIGKTSVRIIWDERLRAVRGFVKNGNELVDELTPQMHYWFSWAAFHPTTEVYSLNVQKRDQISYHFKQYGIYHRRSCVYLANQYSADQSISARSQISFR